MATGLLIRDFFKEYRELRYTGSGSIRLTEIEHNAYRNALTLEITHIDAPRYENLKTLPNNSHFGYATFFKGSTVSDSIAIKYPKFRIFDIRNDGVWQYHQHSESMQLLSVVATEAAKGAANGVIESLGEVGANVLCFLIRLEDALPGGLSAPQWVVDVLGCDPVPPDGAAFGERYRAFPVASPFPDVVKFKADVPVSFLFRLESWYLVNPSVYIVDNPTDTGDATEGEDEYPDPDSGDGDGDGSEFPVPDLPDGDNDPRDYGGGQTLPPGVEIEFTVAPILNGQTCENFPESISNFRADSDTRGFQFPLELVPSSNTIFVCGQSRPQGFVIRDAKGDIFLVADSETQVLNSGATIKNVRVVN